MSTVFVFAVNVCSLPEVISICCSEFYFAVTVVGHRRNRMRENSSYTETSLKFILDAKITMSFSRDFKTVSHP